MPPVLRVLRVIVPWVLLLVVVVRLWGIVGDYRHAKSVVVPTSTVEATGSAKPAVAPNASPGGGVKTAANSKGTVTVLIAGLNLRVQPSTSGAVVTSLAAKQRLVFLGQKGAWYQVRTSGGKVGWVTANKRWTRLQR